MLVGAEVAVLTTSREPLGVARETVWQVPPLDEDGASPCSWSAPASSGQGSRSMRRARPRSG